MTKDISLLRYTDILEAHSSFYIAGLWLLAAGWRDWAYFVWSRLIEMCEPSPAIIGGDVGYGSQETVITSQASSHSKFQLELKRAGMPLITKQSGNNLRQQSGKGFTADKMVEESETPLLSNVFVKEEEKQERLSQVRAWLLECLLEKDGSGAISRLVLDERGQFECSLMALPEYNSSQQLVESCLLCGYPVFETATLTTPTSSSKGEGREKFLLNSKAKLNLCMHLNEWESLQLIAKQPNIALDNNQTMRFEKVSGKNEWEHLQRLTLVGANSTNLISSRKQQSSSSSSSSTSNEIGELKEKKKRPIIRLGDVIDFLTRLGDKNLPVK